MMKRHIRRLIILVGVYVLIIAAFVLFINPLLDSGEGTLGSASGYFAPDEMGSSRTISSRAYRELTGAAQETPLPEGFALALENDALQLYLNEKTGEIALRNKQAETIWYSNPQDRDTEALLNGNPKNALGGQLSLVYHTDAGKQGRMDSVNDCVANGGLSSEIDGDRLVVTYDFRRDKITINDLPNQISAERYDQFLQNLDADDQKKLNSYYKLMTSEGLSDSVLAKMEADYARIREHDVRYISLSATTTTERSLRRIAELWETAGYTQEDYEFDMVENQLELEQTERVFFTIPVEYSLDGDGLVVRLRTEAMDVSSNANIYSISLLEYFGAGGLEDDGYLLLPDGSGALMYFNNGKSRYSQFSMGVYRRDQATTPYSRFQVEQGVKLPVFGIHKGTESLFAMLEEGASKATLTAGVSGMVHSYNAVYPSFAVVNAEVVVLTQEARTSGNLLTEKSPYQGDYVVRYVPLWGEDAGYTGMAKHYRAYLRDAGILVDREASESLPVVATTIGAVTEQKIVMGVTTDGVLPITTYADAAAMAQDLKAAGLDGLMVRYQGWFNKGLWQTYAGRVSYPGELGGKKGYESLVQALDEQDIPFYPEVFFQSVRGLGNGYSSRNMSLRSLSRDVLYGGEYDYISRTMMHAFFRVSPAKVGKVVEDFEARYPYGTGISLADLGNYVNTDFNIKQPVDRESAVGLLAQAAAQVHERHPVMAVSPNVYLLPSVDIIIDLPCEDSWIEVVDEAVPFYQMVLRGSIEYVTRPLNYMADYRTGLLQAVEFGAGLNYLMMQAEPAVMKDSYFYYLYTGSYSQWVDTMVEDYARVSQDMNVLQGLAMTDHKRLSDSLFMTEYENGTRVYVNYADDAVTHEGIRVGGKDYKVVR